MTRTYTEVPARSALTQTSHAHVVVATPHTRVSARIAFVDWLRLAAAFQMLQGHTIAALLAPSYRVGNWYALWSAARGLTSVAFLFAAGLSFYIATARDYAAHRRSRAAILHRVRRGATLIAIGYVLHLPLGFLDASPVLLHAALQRWVAVDVLQCIGVSLLCLEALVLLLESPARLALTSGLLAAGVFALTPLAAQAHVAGLPSWLAAYVNTRDGSLFPLLPWAAHMFAGVACAALFARAPERGASRLAFVALPVIVLGLLLRAGHASPVLCDHILRLGWVVLASAGLAGLAKRAPATPPFLQLLAGETLFLYVFHVLLVYGDSYGLGPRIGQSLNAGLACAAAGAVVSGSCVGALLYHRLRAQARARLSS